MFKHHTNFTSTLLVAALSMLAGTGISAKDNTGLSAQEAAAARSEILSGWRAEKAAALRHNDEQSVITIGDNHLKFWYKEYGEEPEGGHSLWISMHGGGGTTEEVNNGQWENQKRLYKPEEGYYLCPRAPWNAWDMWFQEPIDAMFEELITTMITVKGVNPDKIYIMGYSAGGDGSWRLSPRLADHWAAAAMMAGHPGDVSLVNVRNLPFTIWVGGQDYAYDRNVLVEQRGHVLDALQAADPEGYVHEWHVLRDKAHWMYLEDAVAVPWMAQFTRNPYPARVVWNQEEVLRQSFYWIEAPKDGVKRDDTVIAGIKGNVITIEVCDYPTLTLLLNDSMVDLDKPVKVVYQGRTIFRGKVPRSREVMTRTLYERNDPSYMFDAGIELNIPQI